MKKLIAWSKANYPYLPWRKERSLYLTLVSEIMLQQTTVSTVMNRFNNFIEKFPSVESLATASMEEVLKAWEGLGYYRRARNLKAAAEMILTQHQGNFPKNFEELKKIKGIGDYTANALLAIGMNQRALAIDANIERVLSRYFAFTEAKGPLLMKRIASEFKEKRILKEKQSYRELNEALMDVGRVLCKARSAHCELCPLSDDCQAFKLNKPLNFPVTSLKAKEVKQEVLSLLRLIVKKHDQYLVYQKKDNEWLSGQWEFPTFILESSDPKLKQYPPLPKALEKYRSEDLKKLKKIKTGITKYKITNYFCELPKKPKDLSPTFRYKKLSEIQLSSACQKVLETKDKAE